MAVTCRRRSDITVYLESSTLICLLRIVRFPWTLLTITLILSFLTKCCEFWGEHRLVRSLVCLCVYGGSFKSWDGLGDFSGSTAYGTGKNWLIFNRDLDPKTMNFPRFQSIHFLTLKGVPLPCTITLSNRQNVNEQMRLQSCRFWSSKKTAVACTWLTVNISGWL